MLNGLRVSVIGDLGALVRVPSVVATITPTVIIIILPITNNNKKTN